MNTPITLIALCTCVLCLGACDRAPTTFPSPMVSKPVPADSGATAASAADPSVPSAGSVLSPPTATKADPALGRSNRSMSAAQESTAMPMPGQNNDHSAPLNPAKPPVKSASSP